MRRLVASCITLVVLAAAALPISASASTVTPPAARHVVAAATRPPLPTAAGPAMDPTCIAILDGFGGLHCGHGQSAPYLSGYWPGWEIARGFALFPNGLGGYVLDGWGGVHEVGDAPAIGWQNGYWPNWDIARAVALAPWSTESHPDGWVLDGFGAIHEFGLAGSDHAAEIHGSAYWPGWDIARSLIILPDSTPLNPKGYVMDGFGGFHKFGVGTPEMQSTAYWPGFDIAKQAVLTKDSTTTSMSGVVVDGWGGLHPIGTATVPIGADYWPGWDIARGLVLSPNATQTSLTGWTLDAYGGLHAFGVPVAIPVHDYWPGWDIARGIAGAGGSAGTRKPPPPPPPTPWPTRLFVPKLGTNALIEPVGWAPDGSMQIPSAPNNVGWEAHWVIPGAAGNALLDGHLDWYNQPHAVFYYLDTMQPGDDIFVERADGSIIHFRVDWTRNYPWTAQPPELTINYGAPSISLITCTGAWDGNRYVTRLVVHAVQV